MRLTSMHFILNRSNPYSCMARLIAIPLSLTFLLFVYVVLTYDASVNQNLLQELLHIFFWLVAFMLVVTEGHLRLCGITSLKLKKLIVVISAGLIISSLMLGVWASEGFSDIEVLLTYVGLGVLASGASCWAAVAYRWILEDKYTHNKKDA